MMNTIMRLLDVSRRMFFLTLEKGLSGLTVILR